MDGRGFGSYDDTTMTITLSLIRFQYGIALVFPFSGRYQHGTEFLHSFLL